ncbi:DUF3679 domain-containing protein [Fervidibacillus halotolerans]|uniref:YqxA family protein n=1 Tax=Fervidibacillus halotolerans TaxID=2980027 RepID=A0A9E8LZE3_9BACI|nr:DUF3679 domain-containing protein [Fervidibacillus halotolerans]WAA11514.1 YqxA family protein [Fervidibacillus halotolerans]
MIRFFLKVLFGIGLLFFGVLIGIQEANNGLLKMKGYEDPNFKDAFTIQYDEEKGYKATIFGESVAKKDLEEKREQLEDIATFNFFTEMAKKIGHFIMGIFNKSS